MYVDAHLIVQIHAPSLQMHETFEHCTKCFCIIRDILHVVSWECLNENQNTNIIMKYYKMLFKT